MVRCANPSRSVPNITGAADRTQCHVHDLEEVGMMLVRMFANVARKTRDCWPCTIKVAHDADKTAFPIKSGAGCVDKGKQIQIPSATAAAERPRVARSALTAPTTTNKNQLPTCIVLACAPQVGMSRLTHHTVPQLSTVYRWFPDGPTETRGEITKPIESTITSKDSVAAPLSYVI